MRRILRLMGRMACLVAVMVSLGLPTEASAQRSGRDLPAPRLVEDITRLHWPTFPQPPIGFTELGGVSYFFADDGVHGNELWRTDGSAEGTWLVRDICPGDCNSTLDGTSTLHNGRIFFFADDGAHGAELWVSDGSAAGTRLVADIAPGFERSYCQGRRVSLDGFFLFIASDPEHGCELWRSDGNADGTLLVADIDPGANDFGNDPRNLVRLDGSVAMFANSDGLWRTDGTSAGTWIVSAVAVETGQPGPFNTIRPVAISDRIYFSGSDGTAGFEPWTSDGTALGTLQLADVAPGPSGSNPRDFLLYHGRVYFGASSPWDAKLWRTDGTKAGTELFADLGAGPDWRVGRLFGVTNDRLLFAASTPSEGLEIWGTDGTLAGTALVADILPGEISSLYGANPNSVTVSEGRLYFPADDGAHGVELWSSDGSMAGTRITRDIAEGSAWSRGGILESLPGPIPGGVVFNAFEGEEWPLWRSDGSDSGTVKITTLDDQASSFRRILDFRMGAFGNAGDELFFVTTDDDDRRRLRITDGTPAGTRILASAPDAVQSLRYRVLPWTGEHIYFAAEAEARELWVSDGSNEGTYRVDHLFPGLEHDSAISVTPYLGDAIVGGQGGVWRSDATPQGTEALPPLTSAGAGKSSGGLLFLPAESDATGWELWAIEGAEGKPRLVLDILPGEADSRPGPLATSLTSGSALAYFFAEDLDHGRELWVSDGSSAGTHLVSDLRPGPTGSFPPSGRSRRASDLLVALGERAIFVADDGVHGEELFASDGTASGTVLLGDLYPGEGGSEPRWLTPIGKEVFFVGNNETTGRELWKTDGTPGGTMLVRDIYPQADSSLPRFLVAVRDRLFFSASDGVHGMELWTSDGSAAGTRMEADIYAGSAASSPTWLTAGDRRLFFIANDGIHGAELFSLALDGLFSDGFETGDASRWSEVPLALSQFLHEDSNTSPEDPTPR